MSQLLEKSFEAYCLIKAAKEVDGELLFSGPVASENEDFDGETLEKAGVMRGLDVHEKLGAEVDWDHMYPKTHDPQFIIGKGVYRALVDGMPWLTTRLYKAKPMAQKAWEHHQSGGRLGYSVFGTGTRDPRNPKRIIDIRITWVTIAPQPKGFDQFLREGAMPGSLMAVAKALTATEDEPVVGVSPLWVPAPSTLDAFSPKAMTTGAGVVTPGSTGAPALRTQYLRGSAQSQSFGDLSKEGNGNAGKKRRRKRSRLHQRLESLLERKGVPNASKVADAAMRQTNARQIES